MSSPKKIEQLKQQADGAAETIMLNTESQQEFIDLLAFLSYETLQNLLLIYDQKKTAQRLKTYEEWKRENRQVLRGESAIQIIKSTAGKEKVVSVFDISQTDTLEPEKTNAISTKNLMDKSSFSSLVEQNVAKQPAQYLHFIRYAVYRHFGVKYMFRSIGFPQSPDKGIYLEQLEKIRRETDMAIQSITEKMQNCLQKDLPKPLQSKLNFIKKQQQVLKG